AHLDQAWAEAKRTGDKDVRRMAKTPRVNVDRARLLIAKLRACADGNGTSLEPGAVWHRIEREAERRQIEIALPRQTSPAPCGIVPAMAKSPFSLDGKHAIVTGGGT